MKIVIEIPEGIYQSVKTGMWCGSPTVGQAILNGTLLPKGHGRLIDADAYRKEMMNSREFDFFKTLDIQPTIIEADKETENDK